MISAETLIRYQSNRGLPSRPQRLGSSSYFCATQMLPAAAVASVFWIKVLCDHYFFANPEG